MFTAIFRNSIIFEPRRIYALGTLFFLFTRNYWLTSYVAPLASVKALLAGVNKIDRWDYIIALHILSHPEKRKTSDMTLA